MKRKPTTYDAMKNEPNPIPAKEKPTTQWLAERKAIHDTWEEMFGDRDYDCTMIECTIRHIHERMLAGISLPDRETIREAILRLIETDDWAYELAYGKERIWPRTEKKAGKRRSRKSGLHPLQIAMRF